MELGKAKLLRTGLNALYQAIHPVHGIAWTDGKQVILTALYYHSGEPKFGDSSVVGQFEHVHGLYWGPCPPDAPALLAVQHKKHITIWQLCFSDTERNKLLVSQICDISEPFPVLPQGCVWHPKKEILAVLTTRDASVLHSVHLNNSRIKADIKGSGLIHCACWTKEGNRLVVAVGSALHSYIWDDAQKTLNPCSFCPVFDVGGYICAVEATLDFQVAVATELPLDKICGLNAGVAFEVPASIETESLPSQSSLGGEEEYSMDGGKKNLDSEKLMSVTSPVDLTHILASKQGADISSLLHLRPKDYLTGSGQDSSHLILVTFERKVTSTKKVSIPGILVPDIMAYDPKTQTVAVASNTCNVILVYSLTSSNLPNIQQIQLEKNEKPKGLCFLTTKLLLILVGKQKFTDPAFLPSSRSDKYMIRLMIKELTFEVEPSASASDNGTSNLNLSKILHDLSPDVHSLNRGLLIPDSATIQSPPSRRKLIEEIKSPAYEQNFFLNKQLCSSDADERRAVILCGGKLRLNVVQQIFSLSLVEMQHGTSWIVLTADSEGFVPLSFTPAQEVVVRDGSARGYSARSSKTLDILSSTEGCRPAASESLDITSSLEAPGDCSSKTLDSSSASAQPSSNI
ncbi:WD repeat and coiled-coil-containing protein isoform X2 [Calypte anna]|uniref:WD repeat and coiled-coil-containing protein isoform X2 n=1 Tax=Calypte anna TaxID=9244 RepID=UPI0011C44D10|nr:WD repeat and coiled-coil-containing protein isoform X2 [Calypte anna]